jgi:hypothetical protein
MTADQVFGWYLWCIPFILIISLVVIGYRGKDYDEIIRKADYLFAIVVALWWPAVLLVIAVCFISSLPLKFGVYLSKKERSK